MTATLNIIPSKRLALRKKGLKITEQPLRWCQSLGCKFCTSLVSLKKQDKNDYEVTTRLGFCTLHMCSQWYTMGAPQDKLHTKQKTALKKKEVTANHQLPSGRIT
jgi:hypothetical protein